MGGGPGPSLQTSFHHICLPRWWYVFIHQVVFYSLLRLVCDHDDVSVRPLQVTRPVDRCAALGCLYLPIAPWVIAAAPAGAAARSPINPTPFSAHTPHMPCCATPSPLAGHGDDPVLRPVEGSPARVHAGGAGRGPSVRGLRAGQEGWPGGHMDRPAHTHRRGRPDLLTPARAHADAYTRQGALADLLWVEQVAPLICKCR